MMGLWVRTDNVGLQAMSTATGHVDERAVKPAQRDTPQDLYDPHFPAQRRVKKASAGAGNETFDPHFPQRHRH